MRSQIRINMQTTVLNGLARQLELFNGKYYPIKVHGIFSYEACDCNLSIGRAAVLQPQDAG